MSLLSALNLPTPKHLLPPGGAAPMAAPPTGAPPLPGAKASGTTAPAGASGATPNGGAAGEPRAEAQKLRGAIEARRKQNAELLLRMQKIEPVLKAKVEAASGAEKKALADKQALFAKQM